MKEPSGGVVALLPDRAADPETSARGEFYSVVAAPASLVGVGGPPFRFNTVRPVPPGHRLNNAIDAQLGWCQDGVASSSNSGPSSRRTWASRTVSRYRRFAANSRRAVKPAAVK
jgi:hypothetical protein